MSNPPAPEMPEGLTGKNCTQCTFDMAYCECHVTLKEMPDCRLCDFYTIHQFKYQIGKRPMCLIVSVDECTNGSEFKPAEPIQLYTITSEEK